MAFQKNLKLRKTKSTTLKNVSKSVTQPTSPLFVGLASLSVVVLLMSGCEPTPQYDPQLMEKNMQLVAPLVSMRNAVSPPNKGGLRAPPTETPYELQYFEATRESGGYGTLKVNDHAFLVPEGVTRPSIQSVYLLSHWVIKPGESVLDLGTGSGVQAVFAAEISDHIVATDISVDAVSTAKLNVKRFGYEDKIEVRLGDLFGALKPDERFDVVLFNIDYPSNEYSQFWWEIHERFFADVLKHLKPEGRIYYQIGLIDNIPNVKAMADKNGLRIMRMRMDERLIFQRSPVVFMLQSEMDVRRQLQREDVAYQRQIQEDKRRER
ncbi:MAG: tRNA (adenine(22)-N(1))-methyltransferase TrmK [Ectothiorhodospiraceae bacterium]|nr:tRNA (adenine(22)-N(1))-methyltransferase TrmK [Ectothiorhodospiraceae bacterium]